MKEMARIYLMTGGYSTETIEVEGTARGDIVGMIDGYYEEHQELPVRLFDMMGDDLTDEDMETMIPINGGEYWIEGVSHIEDIEEGIEDEIGDDLYYSKY